MAPEDRSGQPWLDIPDPLALARGGALPSMPTPTGTSPTRGAMRARRSMALAAAVAWPATVLLVWGLRPELAEHSSFVASQVVVFGALLFFSGFMAISSGRRGLGRPISRARLAALGAPVAFVLVGLAWVPAGSPGSFGDIGPGAALMPCALLGLLVVLPIVFVALWSMQRAFPSASAWRGAALGAAVGLLGSLALTLHCSSPFGGHVALAHGLPIVIAGLVGGLVGPKIVRA